jgi:predicted transcriptional regulator
LGFTQVFRYTPGKADWAANGLPMEGKETAVPHVSDLAKPAVPVCSMEERIGDVRKRVQDMGWDTCVVVNEQRVVLGLLRKDALNAKSDKTVEQVMEYAPKTYRHHTDLSKAADYMQKHQLDSVLVTTSDGHLTGLLRQEDVQRALAGVG